MFSCTAFSCLTTILHVRQFQSGYFASCNFTNVIFSAPLPDHPRRVTFSEEAQALQQSRRPQRVYILRGVGLQRRCVWAVRRTARPSCLRRDDRCDRPTHSDAPVWPTQSTRPHQTRQNSPVCVVSGVAPLLRRIGCVWCLGGLCSASSPCLSTAVYNDEPPIGVILGDTVGTRTTPLSKLGGTVPSTFKHYTLKRYKSSYMSYTT